MNTIGSIVAITPVWNEPLGMIQQFQNRIEEVRRELTEKGIGFRHFFLDDGALNLPDESSILVRHPENLGLAYTLVDGYEAVLKLKSKADLVVRLDCQEHEADQIPFVTDHLSHNGTQAVILPVWYTVKGEPRPLMREMTRFIADFCEALAPIDAKTVLGVYNQKFPMGFQAFRSETLSKIAPMLRKALDIFQARTKKHATWGFDLLAILLAAKEVPDALDFVFGGWSTPWQENRGPDKVEAQKKRAEEMIAIALELGCIESADGSLHHHPAFS